jgi:hypothetical protein
MDTYRKIGTEFFGGTYDESSIGHRKSSREII